MASGGGGWTRPLSIGLDVTRVATDRQLSIQPMVAIRFPQEFAPKFTNVGFRRALIAAVGILLASRLVAVQVGDSREAVMKEKGAPLGEMKVAGTDLLRYADVTI